VARRGWLKNRGMARVVTLALLVGLVAFHAVNNWLWLKANITILGWDVPSHLGTSYIYNYMLRPLTLKTLFATIVWHPNRPPLPFLAAVPFTGCSAFARRGTMVGVLFLGAFGAVYGIGRRLRPACRLAGCVRACHAALIMRCRATSIWSCPDGHGSLSIYLLRLAIGLRTAPCLLARNSFGLGLLTGEPAFVLIALPGAPVRSTQTSRTICRAERRCQYRLARYPAGARPSWRCRPPGTPPVILPAAPWAGGCGCQAVLMAATIFLVRPSPVQQQHYRSVPGATIGSLCCYTHHVPESPAVYGLWRQRSSGTFSLPRCARHYLYF
jgi:hypothetical protein